MLIRKDGDVVTTLPLPLFLQALLKSGRQQYRDAVQGATAARRILQRRMFCHSVIRSLFTVQTWPRVGR
jgi:hypothetical protein